MKTNSATMKQSIKRVLAGAGIAVLLPLTAFAQSATPDADAQSAPPAPHMRGGPDGGPMGPMGPMGGHMGGPRGEWGHHGGGMRDHHGAPFLHGIKLTDAQRDKVFAIHHAAEPQAYEKFKVLRKSHEDLRGAATSAQYDEAKVKAAVEAGARAKADLELLRIRSEHEIYALLTPEQKAQVEKNRQNFLERKVSFENRRGPGGPGMQRGGFRPDGQGQQPGQPQGRPAQPN